MAIERSEEFILAALFLARCGRRPVGRPTLPPGQLGTDQWNTAYAVFFDALSAGRTLRSFHNSLKATRDQFDSHVDSGRRGWWVGDQPKPLPEKDRRVFARWDSSPDEELWEAVRAYADLHVPNVPGVVLRDLEAEPEGTQEVRVGREGRRRAVISTRRERSPRLRAEAFRIHGYDCQVCGFNFGRFYGHWGEDFAVVHHLQDLADAPDEGQDTNPARDLAVLCANCHQMVHRKAKQALTLEELRAMTAEASGQG